MNAPDTATSPSGQDAVVQLARPARLPTALPCFGDVFQPRSHAQVDELLTQAETVIEASSGRLEALAVLFKMQADGPCDGAMTAVLQSAEQQLAAVPRPELLELHFYLGSCWVDRSELDSRGRSIGIDAMHDKTRELLEGHQEQARRLLRDKNRCGM